MAQIVYGTTNLMVVFGVVGLWAGWVVGTLKAIAERLRKPPD
jgi:hypothetical protein